MAKRSPLVLSNRVYEVLKSLLDQDVFVETVVDTTSRSFSRSMVIDGQYIVSTTIERLLNWGLLEERDDTFVLTNKGRHMLETKEGIRIE